jgi:hypothetical protein
MTKTPLNKTGIFALAVALLFGCLPLYSQGPLRIGVNVAPLIRQFFSLSDEPAAVNPYILIGEYQLTEFGLRAGLGFNNTYGKQLPDPLEGTPEIITETMANNFRLGYVRYRPLSQKWQLKYGADVFMAHIKSAISTTTTDFFGQKHTAKASTVSLEYGVSPFLFLQWDLNDRLSLGTEVLATLSYRNDVTKEENTQFPDRDDIDESNSIKYNILAPTSVFLIYRW